MSSREKKLGRPQLPKQVFDWREWVGDRLEKERKLAGFSQEQLADLISRTRREVQAWEEGSKPIPAEVVPLLCSALGISCARFFGEAPPRYINTPDA